MAKTVLSRKLLCFLVGHEWRIAFWSLNKEYICIECGKTKPYTGADR